MVGPHLVNDEIPLEKTAPVESWGRAFIGWIGLIVLMVMVFAFAGPAAMYLHELLEALK